MSNKHCENALLDSGKPYTCRSFVGKAYAAGRKNNMWTTIMLVATLIALLLANLTRGKCPQNSHSWHHLGGSQQTTPLLWQQTRLHHAAIRQHHQLRLSKLDLKNTSLWMATPDWSDPCHPHYGAEWYEHAWQKSTFNYEEKVCGQRCVEAILSVVPCNEHSLVFQAGAHLGVFPFMGMAMGCRGLAIEGNPIHKPFMELNAELNGFQQFFTVINSIVSDEDSPQGLSFAGQSIVSSGTQGAVRVPSVQLDTVMKQYPEGMSINLGIIDTEGHENKVLQGAVDLIKQRMVAVWVIEVWYRQGGHDVSNFPGLKLLLENGYRLFDVDLREIGVGTADINRMLSTYCASRHAKSDPSGCLMDHVAVKAELADKVVASLEAAHTKKLSS